MLKEEKIREQKMLQEQKELEGCTFAPKIYTKKKVVKVEETTAEEKRDLGKFLQDQKRYEDHRQMKQNQRKERILQEE